MDAENDDARAPLLAAGPGRRRNSVASMRGEFVSRLPKKVLDAVDPERPSHVDFSRSKGLREGSSRNPNHSPHSRDVFLCRWLVHSVPGI
jgi:hypothetical protein